MERVFGVTVYNERVSGPATLYFDDIEGNFTQQVFECGTNAYAMSFQGQDSSYGKSSVKDLQEF